MSTSADSLSFNPLRLRELFSTVASPCARFLADPWGKILLLYNSRMIQLGWARKKPGEGEIMVLKSHPCFPKMISLPLSSPLTSKFLSCSSSSSSSTNNKLKGKRSSMAAHGWKAELWCYEERGRDPLFPPAFKPRVIFLHLVSEHHSVFSANAFFLNCENLWVPAGMIHFAETSSNEGVMSPLLTLGLGHPFLPLARSYHTHEPFVVHPATTLRNSEPGRHFAQEMIAQ